MRPKLSVIVTLVVLVMSPVGAYARGEASYTLPDVRETVPPSRDIISTPLWTHPVGDSDSNALAIGDGIVASASPELMCGLDGTTGTQLWCAGNGKFPAYAGGVVAYTADDGSVHGLDIKTGAFLWQRAGAVSRYRTASFATSTGNDFLVSGHQGMIDPGSTLYSEITPSGRVLWSGEGQQPGGLAAPQIFQPYAFQVSTGEGATIMSALQILRLGSGGGVAASFSNVGDMLDFNWPIILLGGGWRAEEMQDRFLTFDVEKADERDGSIIAQYHFEPDYDANYDWYERQLWPGNPLYSVQLRIDGNSIYGAVYGKLYRYRLADAAGQRPLLVASDSVFLGGPYRGAVYVSRSDGVWALRPEAQRIRARLVAPSSSRVSGLTITGRTAYIAFADSELRGVNVDDGRTVFDAQPGYSARVGVSANRVFVVCYTKPSWHVVAYPRPDSH